MPFGVTQSLSLGDIMRHIGNLETRIRCLVEGEEVLNAGHIICCGVKASSAASVTVQGLCIQTSHVKEKPHELEFVYGHDRSVKVCGLGHCSCKAGNSQRCKQMIAMLLFVNRQGDFISLTYIFNLEPLTCTDMKQAWGRLQASPLYQARELQDLCHVQVQPRVRLSEQRREEIWQRLITAIPQCALSHHSRGSHMTKNERLKPYANMLFYDVAFQDATQFKIYKFSMSDLTPAELQFYKRHVEITEEDSLRICAETKSQDTTKWQRERKVRITGSKCRSYFTFTPKDDRSWEDKVSSMLEDKFRGNEDTRYGKAAEPQALEKYMQLSNSIVTKLGLVVHPLVPWLGYSPDGIVFKSESPAILLEVKSPRLGKTRKASDLAQENKLQYLIKDGENFKLNPNHTYFSQVQLGMFLLNLNVTHFIVYSEVEPLLVTVQRCDAHIDELVQKLQFVYF
ncbi:unnamed protein product, partial [Ixodes hexagonus]